MRWFQAHTPSEFYPPTSPESLRAFSYYIEILGIPRGSTNSSKTQPTPPPSLASRNGKANTANSTTYLQAGNSLLFPPNPCACNRHIRHIRPP